ncbi:uncharacterized protein LOC143230480 isoform X3 [Tachypleus tridentatus]|uniref:uncharacterized protein LOC143230480 isoform X3 n=1 Tax=Tachypleus tridentatus TaxID=6853 RepID=UPI003FD17A00
MAERRKPKRKKEQLLSTKDEKPSKVEYDIAKYLRQKLPVKKTSLLSHKVEYFIASKAVDCLLDSPWSTGKNKTEILFTTRDSVADYMDMMLRHKFFHRARKIIIQKESKKRTKEKEEENAGEEIKEKTKEKHKEKDTTSEKEDKQPEGKKEEEGEKKKKKIKLDMHLEQVFLDGNEAYVWIYDPIPLKVWIAGTFLVRMVIFIVIWLLTFGKHHLWLLPNLTEDVGFFESFWPLYHYEYKGKKQEIEDSKGDNEKPKALSGSENDDDRHSQEQQNIESEGENQNCNQNDSSVHHINEDARTSDERHEQHSYRAGVVLYPPRQTEVKQNHVSEEYTTEHRVSSVPMTSYNEYGSIPPRSSFSSLGSSRYLVDWFDEATVQYEDSAATNQRDELLTTLHRLEDATTILRRQLRSVKRLLNRKDRAYPGLSYRLLPWYFKYILFIVLLWQFSSVTPPFLYDQLSERKHLGYMTFCHIVMSLFQVVSFAHVVWGTVVISRQLWKSGKVSKIFLAQNFTSTVFGFAGIYFLSFRFEPSLWEFQSEKDVSDVDANVYTQYIRMLYLSVSTATQCGAANIQPHGWYVTLLVCIQSMINYVYFAGILSQTIGSSSRNEMDWLIASRDHHLDTSIATSCHEDAV